MATTDSRSTVDATQGSAHTSPRLQRRLSMIDVLTGVILIVTVGLLLRPGAALNSAWVEWKEKRERRVVIERSWSEMARVATPLYAGGGPPDVIEFSDYECGGCRESHAAVDSAVRAGARIAVVHMPLAYHSRARPAALAALCAERDGTFQELHAYLMTRSEWQRDTSLVIAAPTETVTREARRACMESSDARRSLDRQLELAREIPVRGTPTFITRRGLVDVTRSASGLLAAARVR